MAKLWIDDKRPSPDPAWDIAQTCNEAIRMLYERAYDEISIDRDISLKVTINGVSRPYPTGESFEAVVYFLAVTYIVVHKPFITIHSSNKARGDWMAEFLREGGFAVTRIYMPPSDGLEANDR